MGVRQDTVNYPVHIKNFNLAQLRQLCKELRSDIIHTVSKTGGESAASRKTVFLVSRRRMHLRWSRCQCLTISLERGEVQLFR